MTSEFEGYPWAPRSSPPAPNSPEDTAEINRVRATSDEELLAHSRSDRETGAVADINIDLGPTMEVVRGVVQERVRQIMQYGRNRDLEDGTGPDVKWVPEPGRVGWQTASDIETIFRRDYDAHGGNGGANWMRLVREEVAEAFTEDDPQRLEAELIQVAALCVSWVEVLRWRAEQ